MIEAGFVDYPTVNLVWIGRPIVLVAAAHGIASWMFSIYGAIYFEIPRNHRLVPLTWRPDGETLLMSLARVTSSR
jgi:hypothetical protein